MPSGAECACSFVAGAIVVAQRAASSYSGFGTRSP
jgi:hypothetical protein